VGKDSCGHDAVVRLLLKSGGVDTNAQPSILKWHFCAQLKMGTRLLCDCCLRGVVWAPVQKPGMVKAY